MELQRKPNLQNMISAPADVARNCRFLPVCPIRGRGPVERVARGSHGSDEIYTAPYIERPAG
jgi:hypothetical protein